MEKGSWAFRKGEIFCSGLEGHQDGSWRLLALPFSWHVSPNLSSCSLLSRDVKTSRAVGFQGGPEDPHWLHVCSGRVGNVISREKELGSPWGICRKPLKRLWTPKWSCRCHSRAVNQHGHELHDPVEKAATATRWQAEPSIPAQEPVPGRKTQSGRITLRCPGSLCFSTSRGSSPPSISIWRTIQEATSSHHGVKPLGIQKTLEFQLFHTNSEEKLPGSYPH